MDGADPLHVVEEALTSLAIARLLTLAIGPRDYGGSSWPTRAAVLVFLLQAARFLYLTVAPPIQHSSLGIRLLLLTVTHSLAAYLDCHFRYFTRWRTFLRLLGRAFLYVVPVYPLLMVGSSTLLLFGTSVVKLFSIPHEAAEWLVQLGSMPAPFFFVVLHATRAASRGRKSADSLDLPLSSPGPGPSDVDHDYVRQKRLLRL